MRRIVLTALCVLAIAGCAESAGRSGGNPAPTGTSPAIADRDNTGINERDRSGATKTPIDQNENKKDIDISAQIRKRVVDTKMSIDAQNVKIITQNGKVTLRGPVKSQDEKMKIEQIANDVAGAQNVDNQLEIQS
jgi:hyperosmotically inducible protein